MRKRPYVTMVYLDEEENRSLTKWAEACKMNKSSYIRHLIMGYQPIEFPPLEYEEIMDQLRSLGVNMNQLAVKAHTLGFIDEPEQIYEFFSMVASATYRIYFQ